MDFEHWRHYARGWLFHFLKMNDRAVAEFTMAYRLRPDDVQAARHLAFLAAQQHDYQVADRWYGEVVRLAPDDADSHFNHGYVRDLGGRAADAITSFEQAVALKPSLDRAWYGMGLARARLGDHAGAAAALERATELQPLNAEAWYQLGMARHHAGQRDELKAVAEKLVRFDPKRAKQLVRDTGRDDLAGLIPDLPF